MTVSQKWDKRVGQWHDHVNSAAAFGKVLDRILDLSQPQLSDVCVDLGAGTVKFRADRFWSWPSGHPR